MVDTTAMWIKKPPCSKCILRSNNYFAISSVRTWKHKLAINVSTHSCCDPKIHVDKRRHRLPYCSIWKMSKLPLVIIRCKPSHFDRKVSRIKWQQSTSLHFIKRFFCTITTSRHMIHFKYIVHGVGVFLLVSFTAHSFLIPATLFTSSSKAPEKTFVGLSHHGAQIKNMWCKN